MQKMTEQQFLEKARQLRRAADSAEIDFLEFLYQCEAQDFWRGQSLTYEAYLEAIAVCKAARFTDYRCVRQRHDAEALRRVGLHAVMAAAKFSDAGDQEEVLGECEKFAESNGVPISEQSAGRVVRDLRTRTAAHRTSHRSYSALFSEAQALREKLAEANEKIARLQGENKELRAQLASQKRGPKPAAKRAARRPEARA